MRESCAERVPGTVAWPGMLQPFRLAWAAEGLLLRPAAERAIGVESPKLRRAVACPSGCKECL